MFSGLLSTSLHGVGFVQDRHKFNDTRHGGLNEMANSVNSLAPGISWCDFKNVICNHALLIGVFRSSYDNVLRWMPQDPTDDKSTLVHVMACCLMAPSRYLNQCWPRSPKPYGVSRPQWVNKGIFWKIFDIPASRMLKGGGGGGGYCFHLVHPSICGQNHVCSVSSTKLAGSISCLQTLSTNSRGRVTCWELFCFFKFKNLQNLLDPLYDLACHDDLDLWLHLWTWPWIMHIFYQAGVF